MLIALAPCGKLFGQTLVNAVDNQDIHWGFCVFKYTFAEILFRLINKNIVTYFFYPKKPGMETRYIFYKISPLLIILEILEKNNRNGLLRWFACLKGSFICFKYRTNIIGVSENLIESLRRHRPL